MPYKFEFPFEPPWEDLRRTVDMPNGAKVYIFDTCVERDPAKRAAIDEKVGIILANAERKRLIQSMKENTQM